VGVCSCTVPTKTGMQPDMIVSLSRRVLAESPGMDKQKVALRILSMMLLYDAKCKSQKSVVGIVASESKE